MIESSSKTQTWDIFEGGAPITVITKDECSKWVDVIHQKRDMWKQINPNNPNLKFYTIGAASYLDVGEQYHIYKDKYKNDMLVLFQPLYQKIIKALSIQLSVDEECIKMAEKLSPPGFHIYQGNPFFGIGVKFGGKLHVDLPHLEHKSLYPQKDDLLSFTLPLALPRGKAGMYYWDGKLSELPKDICRFGYELSDENYQWAEKMKKEVIYNLGEMVVHSGTTLHQLASMCLANQNDWRITCQGHGILSEGCWWLYF